jgi:hypothetical protein
MEKLRLTRGGSSPCEEHKHSGQLPCPWPECPNGNKNDFLPVITRSSQEKVFERVAWTSYDENGFYYSWEEQGCPSTYSLHEIVPREIQRNMASQSSPAGLVYHYTTAAALQGIIESNGIWLTDFSYLNDESEIRYGIEVAQDILHKFLENERYKENIELFKSLSVDLANKQHPRVCLACFSSDDDSLSQWRAYGKIALGFRSRPSMFGRDGLVPSLAKVIYKKETQKNQLRIFFHHHYLALQRDLHTPDNNN